MSDLDSRGPTHHRSPLREAGQSVVHVKGGGRLPGQTMASGALSHAVRGLRDFCGLRRAAVGCCRGPRVRCAGVCGASFSLGRVPRLSPCGTAEVTVTPDRTDGREWKVGRVGGDGGSAEVRTGLCGCIAKQQWA